MTRIGSLCSGYGGLEMGLLAHLGPDASAAWHVEYDAAPSKILAHHHPGVPNHGDVKTTDWHAVEPIDWLTAGYPCQPFSHAGKRAGADDPRHLWPGVAAAIGVLRPRGVLLENVRGHVSLGLADVLADLSGLGYNAMWGVVRAADAGAPHGRARIFIVATDADDSDRRVKGTGVASAVLGGTEAWEQAGACLGHSAPAGAGAGAASADAPDDGRERRGGARDGRPGPADRNHAAADANDADRWSFDPFGRPVRRDVAAGGSEGGVEWGAYAPAIARWEAVTGRPAPQPTEPGRSGERLSPRFVEWMMGLPDGHVTAVPGLARNAQLKALGNGVVPQQAALALSVLHPLAQDMAA